MCAFVVVGGAVKTFACSPFLPIWYNLARIWLLEHVDKKTTLLLFIYNFLVLWMRKKIIYTMHSTHVYISTSIYVAETDPANIKWNEKKWYQRISFIRFTIMECRRLLTVLVWWYMPHIRYYLCCQSRCRCRCWCCSFVTPDFFRIFIYFRCFHFYSSSLPYKCFIQ